MISSGELKTKGISLLIATCAFDTVRRIFCRPTVQMVTLRL